MRNPANNQTKKSTNDVKQRLRHQSAPQSAFIIQSPLFWCFCDVTVLWRIRETVSPLTLLEFMQR